MKVDLSVKEKYPEFVTGYIIARGVKVEKAVSGLEEVKRKVFSELKAKYGTVSLTEISEVEIYREFYKAMGVDPSKLRPPTEYLLRKALDGRFPAINNLVDSCLLATIKHWIVVGVYDLDSIKGEPKVTLTSKIEKFETIDGKQVTPVVGEVILKDSVKIISAYTAGDAKASMVTPKTKNALIIAWNAPGISKSKVEEALATISGYVKSFCNGKIEESKVLG